MAPPDPLLPRRCSISSGAKRAGFTPYRGTHYGKSPLKLLIVGESHYDWKERSCKTTDVTRQVVGNSRFFRHISRLLGGDEQFWKRVAFCNYVQQFVGDGPRERPTTAMWTRSHLAFGRCLRELKPHRVLVIGKATWLHMAGTEADYPGCRPVIEKNFPVGPLFARDLHEDSIYGYWYPTTHGSFALAVPVYHPAYPRGFHKKESKQIARRLMDPRWKPPA